MYKKYSIDKNLNEIYGFIESCGLPVGPPRLSRLVNQTNFGISAKIYKDISKALGPPYYEQKIEFNEDK